MGQGEVLLQTYEYAYEQRIRGHSPAAFTFDSVTATQYDD